MGHFDILLLQTPQDLLETALEAGAGDCSAGPGMLSGAPGRPLHLLLAVLLKPQSVPAAQQGLQHLLEHLQVSFTIHWDIGGELIEDHFSLHHPSPGHHLLPPRGGEPHACLLQPPHLLQPRYRPHPQHGCV